MLHSCLIDLKSVAFLGKIVDIGQNITKAKRIIKEAISILHVLLK